MCVIDSPAPLAVRTSPCWYWTEIGSTGHSENIIVSAAHSLHAETKKIQYLVRSGQKPDGIPLNGGVEYG